MWTKLLLTQIFFVLKICCTLFFYPNIFWTHQFFITKNFWIKFFLYILGLSAYLSKLFFALKPWNWAARFEYREPHNLNNFFLTYEGVRAILSAISSSEIYIYPMLNFSQFSGSQNGSHGDFLNFDFSSFLFFMLSLNLLNGTNLTFWVQILS